MQFNYCQACFKKTPQTVDIVKFCAHCGKPFGEEVLGKAVKQPENQNSNEDLINRIKELESREYRQTIINRSRNKRILEDSADEEIDDNDLDTEIDDVSVPNISKLQVEIDSDQQRGVPLSNLAKGATRQPKQKPTKRVNVDQKKFLAEFQKSASTLRNK